MSVDDVSLEDRDEFAREAGRYSRAGALLHAAHAYRKAVDGRGDYWALTIGGHAGWLLTESRHTTEAEALLRWHMRLTARVHGHGSSEARDVASRLAECMRLGGDESIEREMMGACGKSCASCEKVSTCSSSRATAA